MPIAALPRYLGHDFREASPGLRFGLLLPIWTARKDQEKHVNTRANAKSPEARDVAAMLADQGMDATIAKLESARFNPLPLLWAKNDSGAREAWNVIKALSAADRARIDALLARQDLLAETIPFNQRLRLDALTTAPFTTGLGNEHPLENGFAFLNPYGLPYLPGSGVKGVMRQAARELASGEWGDTSGWSEAAHYVLTREEGGSRKPMLNKRGQPIALSMLDVLFGRESADGEAEHVRGALTFWDVIPRIKGDSLMVEIMTPHQSHYYQGGAAKGMGSTSPHESGQPNPIHFLTVPPGSGFAFHVQCDLAHLRRLAPELAAADQWKNVLHSAFQHALAWCGFGAKTGVGYGAMTVNKHEEALREEAAKRQEAEQAERERIARLSPTERAIAEALQEKVDQGMKDVVFLVQLLEQGRWSAVDAPAVAAAIRQRMQAEKSWKETSNKPEKDKDYKRTQVVLKFLADSEN